MNVMASNRKKSTPVLADVELHQEWNDNYSAAEGKSPATKSKDASLPTLLKRIASGNFSFLANFSPRARSLPRSENVSREDAENGSSRPFFPANVPQEQDILSPLVNSAYEVGVLGGSTSAGQCANEAETAFALNSSISSSQSELGRILSSGKWRTKSSGNGTSMDQQDFKEAKNVTDKVGREISRSAILGTAQGRPKVKQKYYSHPFPTRGTHSTQVMDDSYTRFRTKSGKLDMQISRLQSRLHQEEQGTSETGMPTVLPAGRYFDALKGPELEILKDSEEILLPRDQQWPFLLRFPIGCFGITLGLGSQTILWKTLSMTASMNFLHIPRSVNFVLWLLAVVALVTISITYSLKCLFYFEAVRREYYHPVRINFFFAPWIACMFLTLGVPPAISTSIHPVLWCLFMAPIFILELKIYGQWFSGGERRLSKVANPATHLSLVGNFVGALLAATSGWIEPAVFFWAVGLVHYLVLFVTLYQRLPTTEVLPRELHPVFFLFVAAPNAASVAWESIVGDFDFVSRICYFVGLFLYLSLVVRLNFFRGFRFSVAWWAYTFPMTASAIATIHYSHEVTHPITQGLAVLLSLISCTTVFTLFGSTVFHFFFWGTLFPNDIAIAITRKQQRGKRKSRITGYDSNCEASENSMQNDSEKSLKTIG